MRAAIPQYLPENEISKTPPGHRFSLYFPIWNDQWELEATHKSEAAGKVAGARVDHALVRALIARQQALANSLGDAVLTTLAQSTAPFVTGMGYEHPLENGFAFLNPYGLPYLPGSSIKGVLLDAAREIGIEQPTIDMLFGAGNAEENGRRGALNFWDAFPDGKLTVEIMTPHHSDYLQQGGTPHDSEKPNPSPFLAVAPGARFRFFVQQIGDVGDCDWRAVLAQCFAHAWDWLGFGAKTAVGYGAMIEDPAIAARRKQEAEARRRAEEERRRQEEEARRKAEEARRAAEAEARRRADLAAMPAHKRALAEAEEKLAGLRRRMHVADMSGYGGLRHLVKELLTRAGDWDAAARAEVAEWLENTLNGLEHGWRHPDLKAKQRKKWEEKTRTTIARLRGDG
ncbi:MAG: type III-B CRISPR module RAMP protein Cmr6 [Mariprofundaceae bacterium]